MIKGHVPLCNKMLVELGMNHTCVWLSSFSERGVSIKLYIIRRPSSGRLGWMRLPVTEASPAPGVQKSTSDLPAEERELKRRIFPLGFGESLSRVTGCTSFAQGQFAEIKPSNSRSFVYWRTKFWILFDQNFCGDILKTQASTDHYWNEWINGTSCLRPCAFTLPVCWLIWSVDPPPSRSRLAVSIVFVLSVCLWIRLHVHVPGITCGRTRCWWEVSLGTSSQDSVDLRLSG